MQDYETWLIDIGDDLIHRKANLGYEALSSLEKAIYCFWIIDYAIRNSGTFEPMRELHPSALEELSNFAVSQNFVNLTALLSIQNESLFCSRYNSLFSDACAELADRYAHV